MTSAHDGWSGVERRWVVVWCVEVRVEGTREVGGWVLGHVWPALIRAALGRMAYYLATYVVDVAD